MKVLLLGEYSNVHWTLAQGLRRLGHEATVVSDGDHWKGYRRDRDISRRSLGRLDTLRYLWLLERTLPALRGYDVVQLINPVFLDLRAERILPYYNRIRRRNGKLFLGSFGIDKPWVEEGSKPGTFRYSDFFIDGRPRHTPEVEEMRRTWLLGAKGRLFDTIADDCDGIIAGLYENYVCCLPRYGGKLRFIPFPIDHATVSPKRPHPEYRGIRFFVGIQRHRSAYKGTDIMLDALRELRRRHPGDVEIALAESVPFHEYQRMMDTSDVLLDQLYSYTPAMNALLAMAKGIVVVGGGEEEHYRLLGEECLRPVINVRPDRRDIVEQMERRLLRDPAALPRLAAQSEAYTRRWHDHVSVARQYIRAWQEL